MGTWNAGLFSNDTTCDVKDTYIECLKQQLSNEEAYRKTYEEYMELMGTDEEPLFWYALADTQWNAGRLMPEVKDKALECIQNKGGLDFWEERPKGALKWQKTMQKLKEKIESPMPPEKRFPKPIVFKTNPWDVGDIYAYRFHTDKAMEHGLFGKYILFQKLGNVEYYDGKLYSVIQVLDKVFDVLPSLDMTDGIRVLPLVYPNDNDDVNKKDRYLPSFECYLTATMLYEKKIHYPKNDLFFIGNRNIPESEYEINCFSDAYWERNGMEEWLVGYYLSWQNVIY